MELWAIVPELILGGLCLATVPAAGWARGRWRQLPAWMAVAGLAAAIGASVRMLGWEPVTVFHGTYAVDGLATAGKLLVLAGALVTVVLLMDYFRGHPAAAQAPVTVLFATLGAVGLVAALDLGLVVLFLQMLGTASYVMAVLVRGDPRALEAAIKYFVYGAAALAVMAYGLTFLYGLTGRLALDRIGQALAGADPAWIALALALALVGYGFEITLVPFHFWAPDVFAGSTAPVSGFLSVVPKAAALLALHRFLVQGLPGELVAWPWWIAAAAVLTMTWGNLAALVQTRAKRLLAYSSVGQAGYLLLALAVSGRRGEATVAVAFYLAAYLFMNLGAFAVVAAVERSLGSDGLGALRGLGRRAPAAAVALTLALLSLAGLPPLAGFVGKVLLLAPVMAEGWWGLAVLAVANMTLALWYYLRVVAALWLEAPVAATPLPRGLGYTLTFAAMTAGTVVLGVLPALGLDLLGRAWELAS